jgi:hypothetical protein
MFFSCECCVLSGRSLFLRADHSSRGVLPSVVCLSVILKRRYWAGPGPLRAVATLENKYIFFLLELRWLRSENSYLKFNFEKCKCFYSFS